MAKAVSRVQPVQLMTLHNYAVERGLVVGFYCYQPYYPTARFRPSSSCRANLHRCGLTQSPSCDCGHQQTMNHIVEMCPLTKFEGGLNLLHEADDKAVIWRNLQWLQPPTLKQSQLTWAVSTPVSCCHPHQHCHFVTITQPKAATHFTIPWKVECWVDLSILSQQSKHTHMNCVSKKENIKLMAATPSILNHFSLLLLLLILKWYEDSVDNTVEENSSVFSLI